MGISRLSNSLAYSLMKYGSVSGAYAETTALLFQVVAVNRASAQQDDHITIGASVAAVPDYQGADDYRVLPFPLLDVQIGRAFANLGDGIGYNVIDTAGFKAGGSVTYVRCYRRRDVSDGLDRLSDAAGGRLFASLRQGPDSNI